MSSSSKQNSPSRGSVRERAAAARAAQVAAERRRDRRVRGIIALVVVVVIAGLGIGFFLTNRAQQSTASQGGVPAGVSGKGGGVAFGPATGVPVLDVFEDFQCPSCKAFEAQTGKTLQTLADTGKARVIYHPLSFLDDNPAIKNDSSLQAAAASGCAADAGSYRQFHDVVYRNQPQEGVGYTQAQLLDFGKQAGITGSKYDTFQSCVKDGTFIGWANQVQGTMAQNQVTGTPTLILDGKQLSLTNDPTAYTPAGLTAAVAAAAKG